MNDLESLIPWLVYLPMAGFLFTALVGRRLGKQAHWVPVLAIFVVWVIAMALVVQVLTEAAPLLPGSTTTHGYEVHLFTWIPAGSFVVEVGFVIDALTACLLIVVTTIGLLVHVYSIGYMSHDPGYWRFFAYLNLFMFSMLLLVLASSFLVVFVAWELVGLCSYLLIGFWYRKRSAALAAKKAFIVNRVGRRRLRARDHAHLRQSRERSTSGRSIERVGTLDPTTVMFIALLIFAGAMGKSAQFPLHVWLPDAMEGPTPVSALIHAATMVNAGVYLLARTNPIFAYASSALVIVAAIGIFTAILAASIAMTQTDIKRVLAYSTLSQLGYMFAAFGVGAWTAAIFHLMTHGFFKGLLFLGSGSVIHAVHEEQDMRRMGGLSSRIPITYVTMLIGSLAISGIPPLAGFFSKDEILGESLKNGFVWVWFIGFVVAGLTAFYMFRLMGMTFWGTFRGPKEVWDRIHESAPVMTIPLILLAIPSVFLGLYLGLPLGASRITEWLAPIFEEGEAILARRRRRAGLPACSASTGSLIIASVTIATIGLVIAWRLFGVQIGPIRLPSRPERVRELTARAPFLYRASLNKWWFDDLYHLLFMVIGGKIAMAAWWFDREVDRRHGERASARAPSTPVAGCARSRPAASRTTRSASPSG